MITNSLNREKFSPAEASLTSRDWPHGGIHSPIPPGWGKAPQTGLIGGKSPTVPPWQLVGSNRTLVWQRVRGPI